MERKLSAERVRVLNLTLTARSFQCFTSDRLAADGCNSLNAEERAGKCEEEKRSSG